MAPAYIVAATGASGAVYCLRLIEELIKRGNDVVLTISPCGFLLMDEELGLALEGGDVAATFLEFIEKRGALRGAVDPGSLSYTRYDDLASPLASGSALNKEMVICPCSMGTLARVAAGTSTNIIERAADCVLKEGGRLVLVPRETPLSSIHLENMLRLAHAGARILPAMPAFYHRPETIEEIVDFVVGKILDTLGIENSLYRRWKGRE